MKKKQSKQSKTYTDTVARDFRHAVVIVSLAANVYVFVSWLTLAVISA